MANSREAYPSPPSPPQSLPDANPSQMMVTCFGVPNSYLMGVQMQMLHHQAKDTQPFSDLAVNLRRGMETLRALMNLPTVRAWTAENMVWLAMVPHTCPAS